MYKAYRKLLDDFTSPECDRLDFLKSFCQKHGINYHLLKTGNWFHLLIPPEFSDTDNHIKTFTAHYDRFPGSPGANDNSAAVIQLLLFYNSLKENKKLPPSFQILLTDGEEIREKSEIKRQGAFRLGEILNHNKIANWFFLIFDLCGTGSHYIYDFCTPSGKERTEEKIISVLKKTAGSHITRDTHFASDDLGLRLMKQPVFRFSLIPESDFKEYSTTGIPPAWKRNHTDQDNCNWLDEKAFDLQMLLFRNLISRNF